MQDLKEVSRQLEGCAKSVHAAMAHHPWASPQKPATLIRLTTLT